MKKRSLLLAVVALFSLSVVALNAHKAFAVVPVPGSTGGTPTTASQPCPAPTDVGKLFSYAICILGRYVVPFLFALGLVIFLVGVVKYIKSGDNEEAREAGRGLMLFGIIALFVMTAVWGLVEILYRSIFGGTSRSEFKMPGLPPASPPFESN